MASKYEQGRLETNQLKQQKAIPQLNGDVTQVARGDGTVADPAVGTLIGGFTIGATKITAGSGSTKIDLDSAGNITLGVADGAHSTTRSISSGTIIRSFSPNYWWDINAAGGAISGGTWTFSGDVFTDTVTVELDLVHNTLYLSPVLVSALPSPSIAGMRAFVTNALVGLSAGLGLVVTGGGANFSPVYSDGAAWRQG